MYPLDEMFPLMGASAGQPLPDGATPPLAVVGAGVCWWGAGGGETGGGAGTAGGAFGAAEGLGCSGRVSCLVHPPPPMPLPRSVSCAS